MKFHPNSTPRKAILFALLAISCMPAKSNEGKAAYAQNCASCHGGDLQGGFGPALNSDSFVKKWAGLPQTALGTHISTTMPPAIPGGLDAATYALITRFIEAQSGLASQSAPGAESEQSHAQVPAPSDPEIYQDAYSRAARDRLAVLIQAIRPATEERLRAPNGDDWLGWSGGWSSQGFSQLEQINRTNVHQLTLAWSLALRPGTNALAPLVNDGVMFVNQSGTVQALDARNGDPIWSYSRAATNRRTPNTQPRGIALYEGAVYVPTIDNHVLALDAKTGALLWDHAITAADSAFVITAAPLVVRGKVLQGMSGCFYKENPGGCFIVALDAKTGQEAWRFETIAKPGSRDDSWNGAPVRERYGASVWTAGSYDPALNLVFFGASQTYYVTPLLKPDPHKKHSADALYTNTTLALNPDTGKLVWHYQHLPGDIWDLDWAFERTLIDLPTSKGVRKAVLTVGKQAIVEALDAKTGKYLWSVDLGLQNVVKAIDPKTGKKRINPEAMLVPSQLKLICPSPYGAHAWPTMAYDPQSGHLYLPLAESCLQMTYDATTGEIVYPLRALVPPPNHDGKFGQVVSLDVRNQKVSWRVRRRMLPASAALATAGGLLFEGSQDHRFRALDGETGTTLWEAPLNETPSSFPLTFKVEGRQYVAVVIGGGNPWDVTMCSFTPELPAANMGTTLWVFALPNRAQSQQ